MRNHKLLRLYIDQRLNANEQISLSKEQSHYVGNVMRRKIADGVLLFNGLDGEWLSEIISVTKNEVLVSVKQQHKQQANSPDLTLLYSPVKNAKNEFIVQKATEMGVKVIQPIITDNTVKEGAKNERLSFVAIEAAEQCERLDVPAVLPIMPLDKILPDYSNHIIFFCDETGGGKSFCELSTEKCELKSAAILIGPEGGFSEDEVKYLSSMKNVIPINLGPRILRAETAIIAALALWQGSFGDFDKKPDFRSVHN